MKTKPNSAIEKVKSFVRFPYAWPGGYPLFAITSDCGCLCKNCVSDKYKIIAHSTIHELNDGWQVLAVDVNWEDPNIVCDNCGNSIESAYGD